MNRDRQHQLTSDEQQVVNYAKRKRQEEDEQAKAAADDVAKGEQMLQKGQDINTVLSQSVDLDLIAEVMDISEEQAMGDESLETRRRAMAEFQRKRIARTIVVPTDDREVKAELRKLGHPICLFGEDASDRRNRLRFVLSKTAMEKGGQKDEDVHMKGEDEDDDQEEEEEFFTEGSKELEQARRRIAAYSLDRARRRIERERVDYGEDLAEIRKRRLALETRLGGYALCGSQVGDTRPLGRVVFTPDSKSLLTGSWSGSIKLWSLPDFQPQRTFRGHTDRVSGLSFHPNSGSTAVDFASGAGDGSIFLWSLQSDTPVGQLEGHQSRVVHVDHHPSGDYLGSASYDGSWRLWDIATQKELLLQEGHSREVFALRFQKDGALVASAGLDGIGRVWDLRSGRSIMELAGHAKEIFGLDWSPNSYQLASGSADNTVRIFDLRKMCSVYEIPAHKSMVTDIRFFHASDDLMAGTAATQDQTMNDGQGSGLANGQYMATASNDGLVNIWTVGDWKLQRSLAGHVGKVLSVDVSGNGNYIASAGYDRTVKLWGPDDILI